MDKFAIDLEKVLNEFEFIEEKNKVNGILDEGENFVCCDPEGAFITTTKPNLVTDDEDFSLLSPAVASAFRDSPNYKPFIPGQREDSKPEGREVSGGLIEFKKPVESEYKPDITELQPIVDSRPDIEEIPPMELHPRGKKFQPDLMEFKPDLIESNEILSVESCCSNLPDVTSANYSECSPTVITFSQDDTATEQDLKRYLEEMEMAEGLEDFTPDSDKDTIPLLSCDEEDKDNVANEIAENEISLEGMDTTSSSNSTYEADDNSPDPDSNADSMDCLLSNGSETAEKVALNDCERSNKSCKDFADGKYILQPSWAATADDIDKIFEELISAELENRENAAHTEKEVELVRVCENVSKSEDLPSHVEESLSPATNGGEMERMAIHTPDYSNSSVSDSNTDAANSNPSYLDYDPPVPDCNPAIVTDCDPPIAVCDLPITDCDPPVSVCDSFVADCSSPITNCDPSTFSEASNEYVGEAFNSSDVFCRRGKVPQPPLPPITATTMTRPSSLNIVCPGVYEAAKTPPQSGGEASTSSADSGSLMEEAKIGKLPPFWIPDADSSVCMQCDVAFTMFRRRHHCRACGLVLCSKCCACTAKLEYLGFTEARICRNCYNVLESASGCKEGVAGGMSAQKQPNPNNPMEYCSTVPPMLQVTSAHQPPPSVQVPVPVGVLKREGRSRTNETPKQVIFSDGIRPGGDLTELDAIPEPKLTSRRSTRVTKRLGMSSGTTTMGGGSSGDGISVSRANSSTTRSFIPSHNDFPPLVSKNEIGETCYAEITKPIEPDDPPMKFAINANLFLYAAKTSLKCCVNKEVWCMATEGLSCVGQDEIVFILETLSEEKWPPTDIFSVINNIFLEASKGRMVSEMAFVPASNVLFGSKEHGGFVFIRPTFQCTQKLIIPKPPYLIALLIHRWETPWARLFPIRLLLRIGAEYRYYPCPIVSVRNRKALYSDIGHTIINLLADFRKFSYSLPIVRGLLIHMEDRLTTVILPKNRYDQVVRAMNNSDENVLAFAGNISVEADSHLVCMQHMDDSSYTTQAINISSKPRKVTGASFVVFNGSLKQIGWTGKSNIVEDGLMVRIPSESMLALRNALRQMKDYSIGCGPEAEEVVALKWGPDDVNFNIGIKSNVDNKPLDGIPSIRLHNGTDYAGSRHMIRCTEVFTIQSDEETVNMNKVVESIAKATCVALVPLLELLASGGLTTIAVRATIHPDNVGYEAGAGGNKLPPIYMKGLDDHLIPVVHQAAVSIHDNTVPPVVLELIFRVMQKG